MNILKRLVDKYLNAGEFTKKEEALTRREERIVAMYRDFNELTRFFDADAWLRARKAQKEWETAQKILKGEIYDSASYNPEGE